ILHQKHRLVTAWYRLGPLRAHRFRGSGVDTGQVDPETRALQSIGFGNDVSVALRHDAIDRSESEPGAFARGLGRKEWLEQVFFGRLVHPDAGVGEREHHKTAWLQPKWTASVGEHELFVRRLDSDASAARHGIARVGGEVHQDALDLAGI